MSKSHRREVARKLKDAIEAATDPMEIAALSGQLAKYLPKPKQYRRRRGTKVAPIAPKKEITLDELVQTIEKAWREKSIKLGRALTPDERNGIVTEIGGEGTA